MSNPDTKIIYSNPTNVKGFKDIKQKNIKKESKVKSKIQIELDKLRKSKGFRDLGDMLYID